MFQNMAEPKKKAGRGKAFKDGGVEGQEGPFIHE